MGKKLIPRFFRMNDDEYAAFLQAAELDGETGAEVVRRLTSNYSRRVFVQKGEVPLSYKAWKKTKDAKAHKK